MISVRCWCADFIALTLTDMQDESYADDTN